MAMDGNRNNDSSILEFDSVCWIIAHSKFNSDVVSAGFGKNSVISDSCVFASDSSLADIQRNGS